MFNPTREQVRHFFCAARRKQRERLPLEAAEALAAAVIDIHPEYHALLDSPELALAAGTTADGAAPFLHLSLHLAIAEQLSIDQPPGIRAAHATLCARLDPHTAEHRLMDCLAEIVWQAGQDGTAPDGERYLDAIRRCARG
ncbi:DUF1841 family protein [Rhodocyclus tenuis]|uniref:DUF1841 family protein n=1 Tax=Rhodocyclus tenuis TaxID=1066 RepID=UPI001907110B|nr:DUF1841 family protein [Rhodocyclus tenuis]MBK1679129.1 hypothetical protein [Rhodocyclus tenuis]